MSVSLAHLVNKPTKPSDGPPPLLILLHGVGSNEEDLFGLAEYLDDRFFTVSVRAPLVLGPGSFGWYPIEFTPTGHYYDPDEAEKGRLAAEQVIDELVGHYEVNPRRVFLVGFSQGAIMSLGVALLKPEKIAGAVIMSGRLLPEVAAKVVPADQLDGLPIMVTHGRWDEVLPVAMGREINEFLANQPVDLTYREYPMAHQVTDESLTDIAAWLSRQLDAAP